MVFRTLLSGLVLACFALYPITLLAEVDAPEPSEQTIQIDTLILYSPGASDYYEGNPGPRLEHLIEVSNEAFDKSGLDVELRPVQMLEYAFSDEAATGAILAMAFSNTEIKQIRDEVGADIVLIFRPYHSGDGCGSSFVTGEENRDHLAFALISIDCASSTTPHEVGHLFGLAHSHRQSGKGVTEYAHGHGVDTVFTTLMAYPDVYQNAPRQLLYSTPDLNCHGFPCGVPIDQEDPAHAVLTVKQTAPVVAAYRETVVPPTPAVEDEVEPELTPLEAAKKAYDEFMPVYEDAQQQFSEAKTELLSAYTETNQTFFAYISARRSLLKAKNSAEATETEIATLEQAVDSAREAYKAAAARRSAALDAYVTSFYDVLVPAIQTLGELRSAYEEELEKSEETPPAE